MSAVVLDPGPVLGRIVSVCRSEPGLQMNMRNTMKLGTRSAGVVMIHTGLSATEMRTAARQAAKAGRDQRLRTKISPGVGTRTKMKTATILALIVSTAGTDIGAVTARARQGEMSVIGKMTPTTLVAKARAIAAVRVAMRIQSIQETKRKPASRLVVMMTTPVNPKTVPTILPNTRVPVEMGASAIVVQ
jgi:hypothetical protein